MAASKSSDRPRKRRTPSSGGNTSPTRSRSSKSSRTPSVSDGLSGLADLVTRVMKPLGLVLLSRERIEEVLTDAAERGRITRSDANDLVSELVRRGRTETELLVGRARRGAGPGRPFPISGYDALTVAQVKRRLGDLDKAELRQVREYELRHANRRSVLSAIDSATD